MKQNHLLVCLSTPVPEPMLIFFPDRKKKRLLKEGLKASDSVIGPRRNFCTASAHGYTDCAPHFDEHSLFQKVSAVNCQRI